MQHKLCCTVHSEMCTLYSPKLPYFVPTKVDIVVVGRLDQGGQCRIVSVNFAPLKHTHNRLEVLLLSGTLLLMFLSFVLFAHFVGSIHFQIVQLHEQEPPILLMNLDIVDDV